MDATDPHGIPAGSRRRRTAGADAARTSRPSGSVTAARSVSCDRPPTSRRGTRPPAERIDGAGGLRGSARLGQPARGRRRRSRARSPGSRPTREPPSLRARARSPRRAAADDRSGETEPAEPRSRPPRTRRPRSPRTARSLRSRRRPRRRTGDSTGGREHEATEEAVEPAAADSRSPSIRQDRRGRRNRRANRGRRGDRGPASTVLADRGPQPASTTEPTRARAAGGDHRAARGRDPRPREPAPPTLLGRAAAPRAARGRGHRSAETEPRPPRRLSRGTRRTRTTATAPTPGTPPRSPPGRGVPPGADHRRDCRGRRRRRPGVAGRRGPSVLGHLAPRPTPAPPPAEATPGSIGAHTRHEDPATKPATSAPEPDGRAR